MRQLLWRGLGTRRGGVSPLQGVLSIAVAGHRGLAALGSAGRERLGTADALVRAGRGRLSGGGPVPAGRVRPYGRVLVTGVAGRRTPDPGSAGWVRPGTAGVLVWGGWGAAARGWLRSRRGVVRTRRPRGGRQIWASLATV